MKKFQDKNQEKILQSLDKIERAGAPGFFNTRLMARMQMEVLPGQQSFFMLRPAFITISLLLVLVFNIYTVAKNAKHSTIDNIHQSGIESFAAEYNFNSISTGE
jgi:hypothetical protein